VPSALILHTSSKLSNAIRPESEGRSPLLGPGAADAVVDEDELSCEWSRPDPPLHAPSTRAAARAIQRMRPPPGLVRISRTICEFSVAGGRCPTARRHEASSAACLRWSTEAARSLECVQNASKATPENSGLERF
jgi:hypothetical protein